jgi:molybdopterin/thiamine biosynthesis adenylyltransferase
MSKCTILDELVQRCEDFNLSKSFTESDGCFKGEVNLKASPKVNIDIEVEVPYSYPLLSRGRKCCRFKVKNVTGHKHLNADNTICLEIPKCIDFEERFLLELEAIKVWRDEYYINNKIDKRYEYAIVPNQHNITFLYRNNKQLFKKSDWGYVYGNVISNYTKFFNSTHEVYDIDLFSSISPNKRRINNELGLYYFLGNEPIRNGNVIVDSWQELQSYINNNFIQKLYDKIKDEHPFFVFLGYNAGGEIHWLAAKIDKSLIIKAKKYPNVRHQSYYEFQNEPICWCNTRNINYERFFGRGAISKNIKDKKILILGLGAIGSCLSTVLVRSGVLDITLSDFDFVDSGNLCRSEYHLHCLQLPKTLALFKSLTSISPYININILDAEISKRLDEPFKTQTQEQLKQFDLIFNCTADDELIYVLDNIRPTCQIINISITNEAKELMCLTGNDITEQIRLFSSTDGESGERFFEGTGCWDWTFKASFFDINALLNLAIKNINLKLEKQETLKSFVVKYVQENGFENIKIDGI